MDCSFHTAVTQPRRGRDASARPADYSHVFDSLRIDRMTPCCRELATVELVVVFEMIGVATFGGAMAGWRGIQADDRQLIRLAHLIGTGNPRRERLICFVASAAPQSLSSERKLVF